MLACRNKFGIVQNNIGDIFDGKSRNDQGVGQISEGRVHCQLPFELLAYSFLFGDIIDDTDGSDKFIFIIH